MTLAVAVSSPPLTAHIGPPAGSDFVRWVRAHRSAVVVAHLLGFAYPLTSLASAFGIAPDLTTALVASGRGDADYSALATVLFDLASPRPSSSS